MSAQRLFTVIVPTHGRAASLRACLQALATQTLPTAAFEVLVVDDGSPEEVAPIVAPLHGRMRVAVIRQPHSGPAAARNRGAAAAEGRYLAFTDDDCRPAPAWLETLARVYEQSPGAMLGGTTTNGVSGNAYSEASQALVSYLYGYYAARNGGRFFTSNNMAVPTEAFRALGGFWDHFRLAAAEDRDLCERWQRAGYAMRMVPEAFVEHHHVLTLGTFWRQHFQYGRGAHGYHRLRSQRGSAESGMEPFRFYVGLVRQPLRTTPAVPRARGVALMTLTQVANAAGYFYEALRARGLPHP